MISTRKSGRESRSSLFGNLTSLTILIAIAAFFRIAIFDNEAYAAGNPQYIVDFGLPVEIDISQYIGNKTVISGDGEYGEVDASGRTITYTPTSVMNGIDTLDVRLNDNSILNIDMVPASSVYYEEGFAMYPVGVKNTSDAMSFLTKIWNDPTADDISQFDGRQIRGTASIDAYKLLRQTPSVVGSKNHYGYDEKYTNEERGPSNGTEAVLYRNYENEVGGDIAVIAFKGTGIDLRAGVLPDGGVVRILLVNKQNPSTTVGNYIVSLSSRDGATEATSGQEEGGYAPVLNLMNLPYDEYGLIIMPIFSNFFGTADGSKNVRLDGFRVYDPLGKNVSEAYAQDNQANPEYFDVRNNILQSVANSETDHNTAHVDIETIANSIAQDYESGMVLFDVSGNYTAEEIEDVRVNGPNNEFYLMPRQGIIMKVSDYASIGMNAYNRPATYEINNDGEQTLTSNLEMYYRLDPGVNVIVNTSSNAILVLTKVRITSGTSSASSGGIETMTTDDIVDGVRSAETTSLEGTVSWEAPSRLLNTRPDTVTISLSMSNEKEVEKTELLEGDYSFRNLRKYDSEMNRIEYSIAAQNVDGFRMTVSGYDILYFGEISNPETMDNIALVCYILGSSILVSIALLRKNLRKNRR